MDEWKMRLCDDITAPPGFVDGVMDAIAAKKTVQTEKKPIYTPAAKGILCIAAAVLLMLLSIPKLDAAWEALARFSQDLRVQKIREIPGGDDGMSLPGGPVLYVSNAIH